MNKRDYCSIIKRILSLIIVFSISLTILGASAGAKVASKSLTNTSPLYKTVYFGKYVQKVVSDESEVDFLSSLTYDKNKQGIYESQVNGIKVCRSNGKYFREAPIQWRVLKDDGNTYTLLSEKILDWMALGGSPYWDESDIRSYLNEDFYNNAFNSKEQTDMVDTEIITTKQDYEAVYIDHTGETYDVLTRDKVYLLSSSEVQSSEFGFSVGDLSNDLRIAYQSDFRNIDNEPGAWWLRGDAKWSTGNLKSDLVSVDGKISSWYSTWGYGIRPVIRVKKNSSELEESYYLESFFGYYKNTFKAKYDDGGGIAKNVEQIVTYNDKYFENLPDSIKPEKNIEKLSVLSASAAYKKKNVLDFLANCGFKIREYIKNSNSKKENDIVSFAYGIKKINQITLIAIFVKGTSGDYEWLSNFNIGLDDVHSGFSSAEKKLFEQLKDKLGSEYSYVFNENKQKNVRFWITGHSRGAAVANLLSYRLIKDYKANVYAYTFATPAVTKSSDYKEQKYKCIHNYNYVGDFVPELAPRSWGYHRYGDDITSPKYTSKMKKKFKSLTGKKFEGFTKAEKKSMLQAFLNCAGKGKTGPEKYYKKTSYPAIKFLFSKKYTIYKKRDMSPCDFFQNGLGMYLAGQQKNGLKLAVEYAARNADKGNFSAGKVLAKMGIDSGIKVGSISTKKKFPHAHTESCYVSWVFSR